MFRLSEEGGVRCRFFDDRISAGDFCGPGLRPRRPAPAIAGDLPGRRPASAGLAFVIGGDRPGAAPAAGDRFAGATAVAWAAAPAGASVRERFAAGGADGDDMASAALALD